MQIEPIELKLIECNLKQKKVDQYKIPQQLNVKCSFVIEELQSKIFLNIFVSNFGNFF